MGDFHTAIIANNALVGTTFICATAAFEVPDWTKNPLTEEATFLWHVPSLRRVCPRVDCRRFADLSVRLCPDVLWRCQANDYLADVVLIFWHLGRGIRDVQGEFAKLRYALYSILTSRGANKSHRL